jgi:DnaJ-class molecular chaperone
MSDDDLQWYVPGFVGRRRREAKGGDTIVDVQVTGHNGNGRPADPDYRPTRYQMALRRQASNRVRKAKGEEMLPAIRPGSCTVCEGWGVTGAHRVRCPRCQGTGEEG